MTAAPVALTGAGTSGSAQAPAQGVLGERQAGGGPAEDGQPAAQRTDRTDDRRDGTGTAAGGAPPAAQAVPKLDDDAGKLPFTGTNVVLLLLVACGLIAAGAGIRRLESSPRPIAWPEPPGRAPVERPGALQGATIGDMRALPEPIEVRPARPEDAERVKQLVWEGISSYREWAPHWQPSQPTREQQQRIQANFSNPDVYILMAHDADELVGVISIAAATIAAAEAPSPGTVYLWQMFVSPAWQGRGLAGALHDRVVEEARARGFERMVLWAAEGAAQARRFYEREGWTLTGETDPESNFGLPLVQYELRL